jgi:2-methylfumaryl-CoA hydratase
MSKSRRGNFFEDFESGQLFRHGVPRTVTEGDRALYIGLTGSRSALNTASTTAQMLGLHSAPIEDVLVFNIVFGRTVPDLSLNAVANLGYADGRFLAPVFSGDTLSVTSEVLAKKENSNGKSGMIYVRSTAKNQHGSDVLSYVRWVMVHKREAGQSAGTPAEIPQFPAFVEPERLQAPACTDPQQITSVTGVDDLWESYQKGERIDHPSSMTVNDSDHSIATRLYQNNAKAHFDAQLMARSPLGKRLVYGGHVISICRSLAYDGLENSLGMLAINGGRHVSPVFAGDTISCATTVVDAYPLDEYIGALRLRTIGAKDVESASQIGFPESDGDKPTYSGNIVLDLDYTVAIPRRHH